MEKKPLWEVFRPFTEAVREDHKKVNMLTQGPHCLNTHTLVVAQYAAEIADSENVGIYDAWVTGFLHSTDHFLSELLKRKVSESEEVVRRQLINYLRLIPSELVNNERIVYAVLNHEKRDNSEDPTLLVILQDADRLANLVDIVIRSGQFFHNLPPYDPRFITEADPRTKFGKPMSILDDIRFSLEWKTWMRTPKAQELAKPYFDFLELLFVNIERQLKETGLLPHPFAKDYE